MTAYLIVDITHVRDPDVYARYRERVTPGLEEAGGRYLARGGKVDVFEGSWRPGRLVLVEFRSMSEGRRWWESEAYRPLRSLRQASTDGNMLLLEGLSEVRT